MDAITIEQILRVLAKHAVRYEEYETTDDGYNACIFCGARDTFFDATVTHALDCPVVLIEQWLAQRAERGG